MKKNVAKYFCTIAIFSLLAVGCSTQKQVQEDLFSKNIKCKEIADKLDKKMQDEEDANRLAGVPVVPNFQNSETKYSKQLNTCLYTSTHNIYKNDGTRKGQFRLLLNSVSNEELAKSMVDYDQPIEEQVQAQKEFYDKYSELFLKD